MAGATTSVLDLISVQDMHDWIPGLKQSTTDDDVLLQACITAWGFEFLSRTGLGDQNTDFAQSPFTAICNFDEFHDGSGTTRLFLKNRPIRTVTLLNINGMSVAPSTGVAVQGYVIDGNAKSIALRSGVPGTGGPSPIFAQWQAGPFYALGGGLRFWKGIQNIEVQYTAGYATVPADIAQAAKIVVHQNYKRRPYTDEASRSLAGGGGTIRYRDWDIPIAAQWVVDRYTRTL
jgi:hypothetical protein